MITKTIYLSTTHRRFLRWVRNTKMHPSNKHLNLINLVLRNKEYCNHGPHQSTLNIIRDLYKEQYFYHLKKISDVEVENKY